MKQRLQNKNSNLSRLWQKKIAILGMGLENHALVDFLLNKKVTCEITICDAKQETRKLIKNKTPSLKWRLGKDYDKNLSDFDIVFRVAGYPLFSPEIKKAQKAGVEISSPTKLFFELCPTKNMIGITGTKGKGTTASLIYSVLKKGGKKVFIGGNIGISMFGFINKIKKDDWVVLELSSYQLEDMDISPRIAVMTNFYRDHLAPANPTNPNFHKTMRIYWDAKWNIIKWQDKKSVAILSERLKIRSKKYDPKSKIIYFTNSDLPSLLLGEHNKENIAAAVEVAKIVGIEQKAIKKAVNRFKGMEHRLEFIRSVDGVEYYNDSFAVTPEATITALRSFDAPIILLAGGADKNSNFGKLAKEIKKRVKFVILLDGEATPRLKKDLLKIGFSKNKMYLVDNIKKGVKTARDNTNKGDIILLSPACASFGMFKDYKERGELFRQEV